MTFSRGVLDFGGGVIMSSGRFIGSLGYSFVVQGRKEVWGSVIYMLLIEPC
ncbi:hypothetical protein RchiOBHm_Chr4g0396931 [Rosa chinensis]|uniref:Uncharacterized protein n=1 Tax=Rosa chinensis TaxID=74649 RepID=A0A2P6QRX5_ROSCH|nr:hypothetical protein RchiOBHm_Chr4g0396931 [Rosa chinensis]